MDAYAGPSERKVTLSRQDEMGWSGIKSTVIATIYTPIAPDLDDRW
jgi:hypothetical protein